MSDTFEKAQANIRRQFLQDCWDELSRSMEQLDYATKDCKDVESCLFHARQAELHAKQAAARINGIVSRLFNEHEALKEHGE